MLEKIKEIKTIAWDPVAEKEINDLLRNGWKLLHIGESWREKEGGDIIYTLGRENDA